MNLADDIHNIYKLYNGITPGHRGIKKSDLREEFGDILGACVPQNDSSRECENAPKSHQ